MEQVTAKNWQKENEMHLKTYEQTRIFEQAFKIDQIPC